MGTPSNLGDQMKKQINRLAVSIFITAGVMAMAVLLYLAIHLAVHKEFPSWNEPTGQSVQEEKASFKYYTKLEK